MGRLVRVLGACACFIACSSGCDRDAQPSLDAGNGDPPAATADEPPFFRDVAADVGLDFRHFNGMTGQLYLAEMMGSGAALFDADGDGDLDLYAVTGRVLEVGRTRFDALIPPQGPPHDRLFRNDTEAELRFTDVTDASGIGATAYGMGVAVGDYDGDGRPDLYVTALGANRLLHNEGGCRFRDVTAVAGVGDTRWSTSAAFVDVNADGHLDLYVVNYVDFQVSNNRTCYSVTGRRDYCSPSSYSPVHDRLFLNRGDGTFADISVSSQIARARGSGLGVVTADFDGDGRIDIYVANDGDPNQLWRNRGDGTFEDTALLAGCAINEDGVEEAGMGVAAGDYDGDGDEDIILTHLAAETNTLYENDGRGWFRDVTTCRGFAAPTIGRTGFGCGWLDVDNDGDLDFLVANGAVQAIEAQATAGAVLPLAQHDQLFLNDGSGSFTDVSSRAGASFSRAHVGRGIALGDVDDDGDTDAVVTANGGALRLLLNEVGSSRRWVGFAVVDGRRAALGAQVTVRLTGGAVRHRRVRRDGSYLCSHDPRLIVGLGDAGSVESVVVQWVDGSRERWGSFEENRRHTLRRGTGEPVR